MNEDQVRQLIRDELSYLIKNDKFTFSKLVQFLDGRNIQTGRGTGTIIGTDSDQKIGFFGKSPVVQQATIASPAGGITVDGQARSAIDSIINVLKNIGFIA